MRVFLTGLLVFIAFAMVSRWYFVCEIRQRCGNEAPTTVPGTLSFYDGKTAVLSGFEQFHFAHHSFKPQLTPSNEAFIEKAAVWLGAHPEKNLSITGHYLPSESHARSGIFENLGIARAAAIEQLFLREGISAGRITIDYDLLEKEVIEEPVSFSAYTPETESTAGYERLQFSFENNTFSDANFAYNSDAFNPGEQFRTYADSVKSYFELHSDKMLSIIGHTDSIGSESYNLELGLRRAESAARYFRETGVKATISVSSKGESAPVAPNTLPDGSDNLEGRQKNRRVNFKIENNNGD